MTETRVKTEDLSGVRLLTLSRPEKKNAFDVTQAEQLWAAIEAADADDAVRVIAVTAEGDYFTGGADITMFRDFASLDPDSVKQVAGLYEPLRACTKPTVAILQGHCVGMGVTMLPSFDLVYAADHVTFTTPFVKIGLVQEYGSSHTLPRLIGLQRAKELLLRATPLDAQTAADWGLVTRLFPAATLREEALKIATELAGNPPGAVAQAKRLLDVGVMASFDEACRAEDDVLATRYGSPENVAAVTAILSRKKKA